MTILRVDGLSKRYPAFCLRDVSFSIEEGRVMGLIGRNGAGKTTTIKSILRLVRPDGGTVQFLGKPLDLDASALRREAGYVSGDLCYYPRKRLSQLTAVTKSFYPSWDDKKYEALNGLDGRRLARAVAADEPHDVPLFDREADISQAEGRVLLIEPFNP